MDPCIAELASHSVEGWHPGGGVQQYIETAEITVLSSPARDIGGIQDQGAILVNGTHELTGNPSSSRLGAQLAVVQPAGLSQHVVASAPSPYDEATLWILDSESPTIWSHTLELGAPSVGASLAVLNPGAGTVLLGAPETSGGEGEVVIVDVMTGEASRLAHGAGGLGESVAAGDLNGDGINEILGGAPYRDGPGAILVWDGANVGPGMEPDVTVAGSTEAASLGGLGLVVADLDGDGTGDLCAGAMTAHGDVVVVYPGESKLDLASSARVQGPDGAWFGNVLASPGDIDGNGSSELIISAHALTTYGGAFWVAGPIEGVVEPEVPLHGRDIGGVFGRSLGVASDQFVWIAEQAGDAEAGENSGVIWVLSTDLW